LCPHLKAASKYPEPENAPVLFYFCPRTNDPPKVDGVLDDACWEAVPMITDFGCIHRGEGAAKKQSLVRMIYDDEAIYVAVRCLEPDAARMPLKKMPTGHDAPAWKSDSFEIYLRSDLSQLTRYHIIGNVKQARYDAWITGQARHDKPDATWGVNRRWRVWGHVGESAWTLEFRLPHSDFGTAPEPGRAIGLNLTRITWTPTQNHKEFSAWAHATYEQKDFRYWGYLVFDGPKVDKPATAKRLVSDWRSRAISWPTREGLLVLANGKQRLKPYRAADEDELEELDGIVATIKQHVAAAAAAGFPPKDLAAKLATLELERTRLARRIGTERFSPLGLRQFRRRVAELALRGADFEWDVKAFVLLAEKQR